jgi:Flp pilus assembly protein TadG
MIFITLFLLLLFAGTIDFGRAFNSYIVITNAAREGARIGGRLPCKADNRVALKNAIVDAAIREAEQSGTTLLASGVTVNPDPVVDGCAAAGTPIAVEVAFDYTPLLGEITGIGGFRMGNSATSVAFGDDQEP